LRNERREKVENRGHGEIENEQRERVGLFGKLISTDRGDYRGGKHRRKLKCMKRSIVVFFQTEKIGVRGRERERERKRKREREKEKERERRKTK